MSNIKNGVVLSFKEEPGSIAGTLVAYIKKAPGKAGSPEQQQNLIKDLTELCGIDTRVWQPEFFKITPNAWGVTMKQKKFDASSKHVDKSKRSADGEEKVHIHKDYEAHSESWPEQAYNFQLKVEIRFIRIAPDNRAEFTKELLKEIRSKSPKRAKIKYAVENGALLLVDLPDQHWGRHSYGKETGDNFDIKIARKRSDAAVDYFLTEAEYLAKRHPIAEVRFPVGNDIFNYDYAKPYPHTSNNTPQESDGRHQKIFFSVASTTLDQIERASQIAPVVVDIIPGNHDEQTAFQLGMMIYAWFRNNPNITVNIAPTLRKYFEWGKNMIGFSHGQYETFDRLFANMAFEEQQMWGRTTFKYMFTGHMHHKETKVKLTNTQREIKIPNKPIMITEDLDGVMFDRLASLTSNDYYETQKGFLHLKMAEAFVFDKEYGKTHSIVYQLPLSIKPDNR